MGRTWPERFVDTKQGERNQLGNARRHSGQGALVVMEEGPFSRQVIETLAKRAGNICSNPDCQAMATGPGETESQSVRIGEAAHIYGTNACSPRFDAAMSAAVHSDITNAIWLCRDCYQLVVADPTGFPAALLFEWRRDHEKAVTERTGKRGELARQRVESRELEDFVTPKPPES
jgi:hypothetical protein